LHLKSAQSEVEKQKEIQKGEDEEDGELEEGNERAEGRKEPEEYLVIQGALLVKIRILLAEHGITWDSYGQLLITEEGKELQPENKKLYEISEEIFQRKPEAGSDVKNKVRMYNGFGLSIGLSRLKELKVNVIKNFKALTQKKL